MSNFSPPGLVFSPPPPQRKLSPPPPPPPPPLPWWAQSPPPPRPWRPPSTPTDTDKSSGNTSGIIGGFFVFLAVAIVLAFLCRVSRKAAPPATRPVPEQIDSDEQQPRCGSPTAGLPSFTYSQSLKHNVTGGGDEAAVTCSVCLSAFQVGETVRLLPVCLHLYHVQCIDPWLDVHSTCPICRSGTDPPSYLLFN